MVVSRGGVESFIAQALEIAITILYYTILYSAGYTNSYYNIILYNIVQHRLYNNYYKINKSKGGIQQSGFMELFLEGKAFSNSHYLIKPAYGLYRKEPLPGMRCAAH